MAVRKWVILFALLTVMILSGCSDLSESVAKESPILGGKRTTEVLDLETNEVILFITPDYLVTDIPEQQENGSFSSVIYKTDLSTGEKRLIDKIDYVGVYSSDFVCRDSSHFYACYAYDTNFYQVECAPNNQIRLIEFNLLDDTITNIYEFSAAGSLVYIEYIDDERILIYDTGEMSSTAVTTGFSIFDLTQKKVVASLSFDRNALEKPIVATYSDDQIYVLTYDPSNESYQIEVFNLDLERVQTMSLKDVGYLFVAPDESLTTLQYMTVQNNLFILTSFGMESFILEYDTDSDRFIERYVGDRLDAWGEADDTVKGYGNGEKNYLINFDDRTITEVPDFLECEESLSHRIYTFDGETFVIQNSVENSVGPERIQKNYYIVHTEY